VDRPGKKIQNLLASKEALVHEITLNRHAWGNLKHGSIVQMWKVRHCSLADKFRVCKKGKLKNWVSRRWAEAGQDTSDCANCK
jgi:hypothetical protein